jgi:hypothetical protein
MTFCDQTESIFPKLDMLFKVIFSSNHSSVITIRMWNLDIDKVLELLTYNPKEPLIFSSGLFLFVLLGLLMVYNLVKRKFDLKIAWVTLFSYYFYYKSSGIFFLLLFFVSVTDFVIGNAIVSRKTQFGKKMLVLVSVSLHIVLLSYFKYFRGPLA